MSGILTTTVLEESAYDAWGEFLQSSPDGSIYSSPEYLDALCRGAGGRFRLVAVRRSDEIVGGLGIYERDARSGTYVAPRLLLYYNGPVVIRSRSAYPSKQTSQWLRITGALADWLADAGYARVTLKCGPSLMDVRAFLSRGWSSFPSYTYVVPLGEPSTVQARIEQNLRRLASRASQAGVEFSEDDDFDGFLALHSKTMELKGQRPYLAGESFRIYFSALRAQRLCSLFQARLRDGRLIASNLLLLGPYPVAHTVVAGGDPEYLNLGANSFLRGETFRVLGERGYRGNDLTDAALNPVTRFKSQLGGDLRLSIVLQGLQSARHRAHEVTNRFGRRARGLVRRVVKGFHKRLSP